MPRVARGLEDGFIYHVLNRGNGRQEVFHKDRDYKAFTDLMQSAKELYPVSIFGYCLMPNHFHLIVRPEKGHELSRFMQWLMTSHVRRYHGHYGSSGHVWQGRFKSFLIQRDRYLLAVLRYVEANPVRAGLVSSAEEWMWSSHRSRVEGKMDPLLDELPIELPAHWKSSVDEPWRQEELERLRLSVNRQSPFGDPEWQQAVAEQLGLESTLRKRGRPKKGGQE